MPGGDRTGPMGMGPMTGRAAGFCAGYPVPGYMNPWGGRGWGRGWAYPGYGVTPVTQPAPYYPPPSLPAADELKMLHDQLKYAEEDLKAMRERIVELEKEKPVK